eukprot:6249497-Amphidinium_carterae.1
MSRCKAEGADRWGMSPKISVLQLESSKQGATVAGHRRVMALLPQDYRVQALLAKLMSSCASLEKPLSCRG